MTRRPDLVPAATASAAFMAQVQAPAPSPRLHALGGSGVLIRFSGAAVAIDPYLLNTLGDRDPDAPPGWRDRNAPAPVHPADLTGLTHLLITHGHGDHFDVPTLEILLDANPGVTVVLPRPLAQNLPRRGRPQIVYLASSIPQQLGEVTITAIPAAHTPQTAPQPQPDGAGGHAEVGYVVECGGHRVYHAGDTIVYDGLTEALSGCVDTAILPVNGRSWSPRQPARLGNLSGEDAVDLAGEIGAVTVIPVHHVMLGSSAGGLASFEERLAMWPDLTGQLLEPGSSLVLCDRTTDTSARR